jgi:hypothetical protein
MNKVGSARWGADKSLSWEFNCILLALYFTIQSCIQVNGVIYTLQGTRIASSDDTYNN